MKVLMFGWEFPPYSSGGLGTACYGLTKGLKREGIEVVFVVPHAIGSEKTDFVELISASNVLGIKTIAIRSLLTPYLSTNEYSRQLQLSRSRENNLLMYGENLFEEVERYAKAGKIIAQYESFDIIHAHDWMTYKAGIEAKNISGKRLVVHVHSTEFDRTGDHPNQAVYDIEREGMHKADIIIAVSKFTKDKIVEHYGIKSEKIIVVHNAVEFENDMFEQHDFRLKEDDKIVLYLGRITIQKGPDYFLYAAKRVLEVEPNVKFIVVGSGDMEGFMIEKAAELGIADKVLFAGFLKGDDVKKIYQLADLYVMPSISEPFGITPLEAMRLGTPVIISKQSGVSEVIQHCLKVDFWDIDEMANQILAVLRYQELNNSLREHGSLEVKKLSWDIPAKKCIDVYRNLL